LAPFQWKTVAETLLPGAKMVADDPNAHTLFGPSATAPSRAVSAGTGILCQCEPSYRYTMEWATELGVNPRTQTLFAADADTWSDSNFGEPGIVTVVQPLPV
jgi:hypothetical protein